MSFFAQSSPSSPSSSYKTPIRIGSNRQLKVTVTPTKNPSNRNNDFYDAHDCVDLSEITRSEFYAIKDLKDKFNIEIDRNNSRFKQFEISVRGIEDNSVNNVRAINQLRGRLKELKQELGKLKESYDSAIETYKGVIENAGGDDTQDLAKQLFIGIDAIQYRGTTLFYDKGIYNSSYGYNGVNYNFDQHAMGIRPRRSSSFTDYYRGFANPNSGYEDLNKTGNPNRNDRFQNYFLAMDGAIEEIEERLNSLEDRPVRRNEGLGRYSYSRKSRTSLRTHQDDAISRNAVPGGTDLGFNNEAYDDHSTTSAQALTVQAVTDLGFNNEAYDDHSTTSAQALTVQAVTDLGFNNEAYDDYSTTSAQDETARMAVTDLGFNNEAYDDHSTTSAQDETARMAVTDLGFNNEAYDDHSTTSAQDETARMAVTDLGFNNEAYDDHSTTSAQALTVQAVTDLGFNNEAYDDHSTTSAQALTVQAVTDLGFNNEAYDDHSTTSAQDETARMAVTDLGFNNEAYDDHSTTSAQDETARMAVTDLGFNNEAYDDHSTTSAQDETARMAVTDLGFNNEAYDDHSTTSAQDETARMAVTDLGFNNEAYDDHSTTSAQDETARMAVTDLGFNNEAYDDHSTTSAQDETARMAVTDLGFNNEAYDDHSTTSAQDETARMAVTDLGFNNEAYDDHSTTSAQALTVQAVTDLGFNNEAYDDHSTTSAQNVTVPGGTAPTKNGGAEHSSLEKFIAETVHVEALRHKAMGSRPHTTSSSDDVDRINKELHDRFQAALKILENLTLPTNEGPQQSSTTGHEQQQPVDRYSQYTKKLTRFSELLRFQRKESSKETQFQVIDSDFKSQLRVSLLEIFTNLFSENGESQDVKFRDAVNFAIVHPDNLHFLIAYVFGNQQLDDIVDRVYLEKYRPQMNTPTDRMGTQYMDDGITGIQLPSRIIKSYSAAELSRFLSDDSYTSGDERYGIGEEVISPKQVRVEERSSREPVEASSSSPKKTNPFFRLFRRKQKV